VGTKERKKRKGQGCNSVVEHHVPLRLDPSIIRKQQKKKKKKA
jgi:hypothetical protein